MIIKIKIKKILRKVKCPGEQKKRGNKIFQSQKPKLMN